MCIYRELLTCWIDSIHPLIHLSTYLLYLLTQLLISLIALFLLSWLGSAADHRSHTPTTTLFQYSYPFQQVCRITNIKIFWCCPSFHPHQTPKSLLWGFELIFHLYNPSLWQVPGVPPFLNLLLQFHFPLFLSPFQYFFLSSFLFELLYLLYVLKYNVEKYLYDCLYSLHIWL